MKTTAERVRVPGTVVPLPPEEYSGDCAVLGCHKPARWDFYDAAKFIRLACGDAICSDHARPYLLGTRS